MPFIPVETDRLVLRPAGPGDVDALVARRSDPRVAGFQDWARPFPRARAQQMVGDIAAMDGPADDVWYMLTIVDRQLDEIVGDLALRMRDRMRTAEIGYTLASEHWGRGYAVEAVAALVRYLFETAGVTRVFGMLAAENVASAMVLERTGFRFEGRTRGSYRLADQVLDDCIYGMVRTDYETWRDRSRATPGSVKLAAIDESNRWAVDALETHKTQERFVAPMGSSYADALFPRVVGGAPLAPWMRAIEADGRVVGFVMLALATCHHPEPYLWRLLIDRLHQRRGIGRRALDLVCVELRSMGAHTLVTSWGSGRGSPDPFYRSLGFEPTGDVVGGEIEARLQLA